MHFLQNSWLASNWTWLLMIVFLGIATVAYMNNRLRLLKKSLIAVSSIFLLTLSLSLGGIDLGLQSQTSTMMEKLTSDTPQMDSPNLLSNVFSFALDILKDKISD